MCIRDRDGRVVSTDTVKAPATGDLVHVRLRVPPLQAGVHRLGAVSYTHLRAHETVLDLVCRLLLEKKKKQ